MFPLSNLADHGWEASAPRAMRFWVDRAAPAVLGVSNEGMLMPQAPGHGFSGARTALDGRTIMGAVGEASQVRRLLAALGLDGAPAIVDEDEPQFVLDLADLAAPAPGGTLAPLAADPDRARAWRAAYLVETVGETADEAAAIAATDVARHIETGSHRFLMLDGEPVAMTGWNARLPEIVQVGGVYTPPALRGRGHARRALALHLADAAAEGARRATLFASGPAAVRAYEALGFRRIGDFALTLFRPHPVVAARDGGP